MRRNYKEIDVIIMFKSLFNKWWIILLCMVIAGTAAYLRATLLLEPLYMSDTIIFVGKDENALEFDYGSIKLGGQLIDDYRELLETRRILMDIKESLGLSLSIEDLRKRITISSEEGVRFMRLEVLYDDPQVAADIANLLSNRLIEEVPQVIGIENIQIIDQAHPDDETVFPRVYRDTAVGFVIGGILSMYIIFIRYVVNFRVLSIDMLMEYVDSNILGRVMHFRRDHRKKAVYEAYDSILSKIDNKKVIMVSSVGYKESKTSVAIHLAESYTRYNKDVLLVDCDLRHPTLHDHYRVGLSRGLSDLLRDHQAFGNIIKHVSAYLDVLTSGYQPREIAELVHSDVIDETFKRVLDEYDVVVLNVPPLRYYADGLQFVNIVDEVILSVKKGKTRIEWLNDAVSMLKTVHMKDVSTLLVIEE